MIRGSSYSRGHMDTHESGSQEPQGHGEPQDKGERKFKSVFTFTRTSPLDSSGIPRSFKVNLPLTQKADDQKTAPAETPVVPAPDPPTPSKPADSLKNEVLSQPGMPLSQAKPIDVKITSVPLAHAKEGAESSGDDPALKGATPPKLYVSAVREKLSYMLGFQMKMTQLSKQLHDLMGRTARPGKSGKKADPPAKE